mmetsp:Transcript_5801/g.13949  ORF Transcript_5801/g.13949 Transcript_5801/m.13949 type:complete len:301 (-) Transcript_5801:7450-8352(-)
MVFIYTLFVGILSLLASRNIQRNQVLLVGECCDNFSNIQKCRKRELHKGLYAGVVAGRVFVLRNRCWFVLASFKGKSWRRVKAFVALVPTARGWQVFVFGCHRRRIKVRVQRGSRLSAVGNDRNVPMLCVVAHVALEEGKLALFVLEHAKPAVFDNSLAVPVSQIEPVHVRVTGIGYPNVHNLARFRNVIETRIIVIVLGFVHSRHDIRVGVVVVIQMSSDIFVVPSSRIVASGLTVADVLGGFEQISVEAGPGIAIFLHPSQHGMNVDQILQYANVTLVSIDQFVRIRSRSLSQIVKGN